MHREIRIEEIKKIVEDLVKERLPDAGNPHVTVTEDVHFYDDEPILRVRVVYDPPGNAYRLKGGSTYGFTRRLCDALAEIDVPTFPITSFVSSKDIEGEAA
ncbi:MAG: hypothetical protein GDA53_09150 [Rhodobacteraceae bacterium]|nr:hypothetical protein [Paracoccaceae bacterium]